MRTFEFDVTIASDALDVEVIEDALRCAMSETLPSNVLALVKFGKTKEYSEQGWKVARNRKFGVSVEIAGDGAAKPRKPEPVEVGS